MIGGNFLIPQKEQSINAKQKKKTEEYNTKIITYVKTVQCLKPIK